VTRNKARWMLAIAVNRYQLGSHLLEVYGTVMKPEQLKGIEETRANFLKVAESAENRLYRETLA
jgi:hypothetical protein